MDTSSEMIHALLPLYMVDALGASMLAVGLIEGFAEAIALVVKVFSGYASDAIRHRKPLVVMGYGLGALSKLAFPLASTLGLVVAGRFVDRIGKGIRGAPRDALIADLTPKGMHGEAFGLRQSLDTVGAFAGPLLAMALMLAWHDDFRAVFWVAVIPAILSFALILFAVREPAQLAAAEGGKVRFEKVGGQTTSAIELWSVPGQLGPAFWAITAAGTALTLARFSEAFLILRAQDLGLAVAMAPLVLVGMNVVYSATAYPVGKLADRMPPQVLLYAGIAMLIASDVVLALAANMATLAAGLALWGLHMGFSQGVLSAMVAKASPAALRGTAFGVFNLASGLAMLVASALAGALWQFVGPAATFWAGAVLAGISAMLAWSTLKSRRSA
jgi:MFS family permease